MDGNRETLEEKPDSIGKQEDRGSQNSAASLKTRLKQVIIFVFIAGGIVVALFEMRIFSSDDHTFHIAVVGPTSTSEGKSILQGIQLYLNTIKRQEGLNKKRIVLDLFDDQNDPEKAKEQALEIVKQNRAVAVIGHYYSSCSISGGEIYKQHEIPAVSPTSTNIRVTRNNEWYFRTVFNDNIQGRFLATYVKHVFPQYKTASIIHEDITYGTYLTRVFGETMEALGVEVKYTWSFHPDDRNLDQTLRRIVSEIQIKRDAGLIFLAMQSSEGVKLVKLMKDSFIRNPIVAPDAISTHVFQQGFNQYLKEQRNPGFYTDGIYVVTPLIFDTTNELGQNFREAYKANYQEEPDWTTAYAYDTAMVLVEAINNTEVQGKPETLKADRHKIREYLTSLKDTEHSVEGITGYNYFDETGDSLKPISIGMFKKQKIISAPVQFQDVSDISEVVDFKAALKTRQIMLFDGKYRYKTHVVYTGIKVNEISELNISKLTCMLDFYLWFRFQGDLDIQNIEFANVTEPIQIGEPLDKETYDQFTYRLYHVKGRFRLDFIPTQYAFEQHVLGVSFHHRELPHNNLIYVTDVLGMEPPKDETLVTTMKKRYVLDPSSTWTISRAGFFQSVTEKDSLGRPKYLASQSGTVNYSRFNAVIWIKKREFSIRGMLFTLGNTLPNRFIYYLLIASSVIMIIILISARRKEALRGFSKVLWIFQVFTVFLFLMFGELALRDWLAVRIDRYYLSSISLAFDILWWGISAFLLNSALEHFVWIPLERQFKHTIPTLVRRMVAFVIYLLAFFGIIAFVFDQRLTGLLASTGVAAMIIGLAVQINISNIFSGLALNLERPLRVGDWVKINDFPEGRVMDITWRTTRIQTKMGNLLSIPNSSASESPIHNFSYPSNQFWLVLTLETAPVDPPKEVCKILLDAALAVKDVLREPRPFIEFKGQGDSSAIYTVWFKVADYSRKEQYLSAVWDSVWTHLARAGVELATPCRFIYEFEGQEPTGQKPKTPLAILRDLKLFQPFSDEAKIELSKRVRSHRFPPGIKIMREGEPGGDSFFIIVEGVVGIWIMLENEQPVEIARRTSGDIIGEIAFLTGDPRTSTIIAITETLLYEITKNDIAPFMAQQPEIADALSKILTERQLDTLSVREFYRNQNQGKERKEVLYKQILRKIQKFFGLSTSEKSP